MNREPILYLDAVKYVLLIAAVLFKFTVPDDVLNALALVLAFGISAILTWVQRSKVTPV